MKKTMSRLLAIALVLAMVCAMIPAAMAAATAVSVEFSSSDPVLVKTSITATAKVTGETSNEVTWAAYTTADGTTDSDVVSVNKADATHATVFANKAGTAYIKATVDGVSSTAVAVTVKCSNTCTVTDCSCSADHTTDPCNCAACTTIQSISAGSDFTLKPTGTVAETQKQLVVLATYPACAKKTTDEARKITSNLTFTSSDKKVATVDSNGLVKAAGNGKAEILVQYNNGSVNTFATVNVTVASAPAVTAVIAAANGGKTDYKTGEAISLTVTPGGGYGADTYSYQWKKDGAPLDGKTAKTLNISSAATGDAGVYTCEVKSTKDGSVLTGTSNALTITVTAPAYTVSLTPVSGLSLKAGEYGYVYATIMQGANVYKTPTTVYFTSTSSSNATVSSSVNTNATNGTATATVSALKKGTTSIYATVSIGGQTYTSNTVSVSVTSSYTMDTINYESDSDGYATFDGYDFAKAFKDATGYTLSYVNFTSQYGGQLYKDADSTSNSNKVTPSTDCYYNPSYSSRTDLDKVTFIVDSDKKSHYAEFTAYGSSVTATGKVTIDGDGTASGDIVYYVSYEDTVALDEDDFQSFFEDEYSKGTLDHVKFLVGDATYYGTSAYGWLYESDASSAKKVSASTRFYYEADSKQDDLDAVVFTAGTRTSTYTVKIPFTATGKDKNDRPRTVDGKLVIEVNGSSRVTITTDGATFDELKLVKALTPKNVTSSKLGSYYIQFNKVTGGTLYDYYKSALNNEEWSRRDKFYFDADDEQYELGDVFFLPKSNVKSAEITYTLYRESGKSYVEVDTGKITFKVEQSKVTTTFTDIPANVNAWAGEAIEYMAKQGYVTGTGAKTFSPNTNMSRGMLVTVLYRMAGEPSVSGIANPFKDVVKGAYYYNAVLWAYSKGIVTGKGAGKFAPNDNVSRQEIAAFIYRYAGKPTATGSLLGFNDYKSVSAYATDAMKWATRNEVITGIGGKLVPNAAATRAQVATMLYRYIKG